MKKRKKNEEGVEAATKEIQACREDIADMFLDEWSPRGVKPVNGCIALCMQFVVVTRRIGANREQIHTMLEEVIDNIDASMSRTDWREDE